MGQYDEDYEAMLGRYYSVMEAELASGPVPPDAHALCDTSQ